MLSEAEEIEHIFYLYPIAKKRLAEYDEIIQYAALSEERICEIIQDKELYLIIVKTVDLWLEKLDDEEVKIIRMRYFQKLNYEQIASRLYYQNHSTIIRKIRRILSKLVKEI